MQLRDGDRRLSLHHLHVLEALDAAAVEIRHVRVVLQHPAHHFVIRDSARERVSQRLENEKGERLRIRDRALGGIPFALRLRIALRFAARARRGKNLHQKIQQRLAADIF